MTICSEYYEKLYISYQAVSVLLCTRHKYEIGKGRDVFLIFWSEGLMTVGMEYLERPEICT